MLLSAAAVGVLINIARQSTGEKDLQKEPQES
jgi:hypothetical protein